MNDHIVIVAAHPDDAELMFGGIIHKAVKHKQVVSVIIATDGSKWSKINTQNIKKIRQTEALEAAKILGIKNVKFLDFEDGTLTKDTLFSKLFEALRQLQPSIILTHNLYEGHPDHIVVSQTVQRICNIEAEPMPLESDFWHTKFPPVSQLKGLYILWKENISKNATFVRLTEEDIKAKSKALCCYKSQFPNKTETDFYRKELTLCGYYGIMGNVDYAEPLERLNVSQQETVELL